MMAHGAFGRVLISIIVVCTLVFVGCSREDLSDKERAEVMSVFYTGLEFKSDPYVRAETLRMLEVLADPGLASLAEPLVQDPSPMVRMAAVRVLLKSEHPQARQRAMAAFNSGKELEKIALLRSAIELGNEPLRRTLIERALRASEPRVRTLAFEHGPLVRFDEALAKGQSELLARDLIPEMNNFVEDEDDQLAATALSRVIEGGQGDRAQPLIERFQNERESVERRVGTGRTLIRAKVKDALPVFEAILEEEAQFDAEVIGVPQRRRDPAIVRTALLGAAALGDATLVPRVQEMLDGADVDETIEILEALAANSSTEATVSLRIALRDARVNVRRPAIRLYASREDAQPDALIGAMSRHEDMESQTMIAHILATRFAEAWSTSLRKHLESGDERRIETTLALLRRVIRTEEQFALLATLAEPLRILAKEENEANAMLASYLLLKMPEAKDLSGLMNRQADMETWYAYLEYLVSNPSKEQLPLLRENLYADLFALRLMSAAGLWALFPSKLVPGQDSQQGDGEE